METTSLELPVTWVYRQADKQRLAHRLTVRQTNRDWHTDLQIGRQIETGRHIQTCRQIGTGTQTYRQADK